MSVKVGVGVASDIGRVRTTQEDAWQVWRRQTTAGPWVVAAVADGMGGAAAGDVASRLAIDALDDALKPALQALPPATPEALADLLHAAVLDANRRVFRASRAPGRQGMGTTLTCVALTASDALVVHVGDSRAFLLRDMTLYPLTRDHSWVETQVAAGAISRAEAESHELRHVITRVVGGEASVVPDELHDTVQIGDVYLLCSDGLHALLSLDEVAQLLARHSQSPQQRAEALVALALARGGHDNVTALVLTVDA